MKNVRMACLFSCTWRGRTSQDEDAAYVKASNESHDSHDSSVASHPLFHLELRGKHSIKIKLHQIPSRVTTRAVWLELELHLHSLIFFVPATATSTSSDGTSQAYQVRCRTATRNNYRLGGVALLLTFLQSRLDACHAPAPSCTAMTSLDTHARQPEERAIRC